MKSSGRNYFQHILSHHSDDGGSQRVTLVDGIKTAEAQECKYCRIQCVRGNSDVVRVRLKETCSAITGVELPGPIWDGYPINTLYSISNLNMLNFFSNDKTADIDVEWFD